MDAAVSLWSCVTAVFPFPCFHLRRQRVWVHHMGRAHGHLHLTPTGASGPWKPRHEAPGTLSLFWCWCRGRFEAWQVLSQQSVGGFNASRASPTSCGWAAVAPKHFHFVITGGGGKTDVHSSACRPLSCREGAVCEHDPETRSSPLDV